MKYLAGVWADGSGGRIGWGGRLGMAIANEQRVETYKLIPTDHEHLAQVDHRVNFASLEFDR
jgi:hypothetical protein